MPITASDYYKAHDRTIASLTELRTHIDAIDQYAARRNLRVFWRGQLDHRWGLTSSIVRSLSVATVPDDILLNKVEDRIVTDASEWVSALSADPYRGGPLAQLAYIQHHGVPTRLLDFTRNPWVAVFFAVETGDEFDGRVFAILVEEDALVAGIPTGFPWRTYRTSEIRVWDPAANGIEFPRLLAQEGVLAVGRLPSTQPHRKAWDSEIASERSLLAEEVRRIMSIPIKLTNTGPISDRAVPPISITLRIHIDKESVRKDLAGVRLGRRISPPTSAITHKTMYPDVQGLTTHSQFLRGLQRGLLLV